ncbi:Uncharacterised protein [Burkholderia pseudomallei]|nr:Uncharacterised protein [Burkholderia pseudomallei]
MNNIENAVASLDFIVDRNEERERPQQVDTPTTSLFDVRVSKETILVSARGLVSAISWRPTWGDGVKRLSVQRKTLRHGSIDVESHCVVYGADATNPSKSGELVAECASADAAIELVDRIDRGIKACLTMEEGPTWTDSVAEPSRLHADSPARRTSLLKSAVKNAVEAAKVIAFVALIVAALAAAALVAPAAWKVGSRIGSHIAAKVPSSVDRESASSARDSLQMPVLPQLEAEVGKARRSGSTQ